MKTRVFAGIRPGHELYPVKDMTAISEAEAEEIRIAENNAFFDRQFAGQITHGYLFAKASLEEQNDMAANRFSNYVAGLTAAYKRFQLQQQEKRNARSSD